MALTLLFFLAALMLFLHAFPARAHPAPVLMVTVVGFVIPVPPFVIPAKAGTHSGRNNNLASQPVIPFGPRLRGGDEEEASGVTGIRSKHNISPYQLHPRLEFGGARQQGLMPRGFAPAGNKLPLAAAARPFAAKTGAMARETCTARLTSGARRAQSITP